MSKAYLLIDEANLCNATKKGKWSIDWEKFLQYFESRFTLHKAILYEGMPTVRSIRAVRPSASYALINRIKRSKRKRFARLRQYGYVVCHKPVATINNENKCNFDVEITVDALAQINNYEVFILASGDGDFIRLIKYLKQRRKQTVIVSPRRAVNDTLRKTAAEFISLNGIRSYVENKPGPARGQALSPCTK